MLLPWDQHIWRVPIWMLLPHIFVNNFEPSFSRKCRVTVGLAAPPPRKLAKSVQVPTSP